MKIKSVISLFLVVVVMVSNGCRTVKENKRAFMGAGAGVLVGGALGGIIGKSSGNTGKGVLIGAAVGGVAGAAIGHYMDRQKAKLQKDLGKIAKVERVGEGLQITFDSGILFNVGSDKLSPEAQTNLKKLSETLREYNETYILIDGHTDNTGSDELNQKLSEKRAESVSQTLQEQGITTSRLGTRGFGKGQPVADNTTEVGRKQNRRVEIAIWANEKLREKAQKGELK